MERLYCFGTYAFCKISFFVVYEDLRPDLDLPNILNNSKRHTGTHTRIYSTHSYCASNLKRSDTINQFKNTKTSPEKLFHNQSDELRSTYAFRLNQVCSV